MMKKLIPFLFFLFPILTLANKFYPTKGSDGGIYLTAATYDTVVFWQNFKYAYCKTNGTVADPIVFINEGFISDFGVIAFDGCKNIKFTGTGVGAKTITSNDGKFTISYGIYIHDRGGPAINIDNNSENIEIENIRIERVDYFGWVKKEIDCNTALNYPNVVIKSIYVHDVYCKGAQQDGWYFGSTAPTGGRSISCGGTVHNNYVAGRLQNIAVNHIYIDSCGRTGIQFSGVNAADATWFNGENVFTNSIVKNCGWEFNPSQGAGVFLGGMANHFRVEANFFDSTWTHGVFSYGVGVTTIQNNVINNTGYVYGDSCDRNAQGACIAGTNRLGVHRNDWQGNVYQSNPNSLPSGAVTTFKIMNNNIGVNTDHDNYKVYVNKTTSNATYASSGNIICNNGKAGADAGVNYSTSCVVSNLPPVVDAGPNDGIKLPVNTYKFNASSASDPDGNIVSYLWTLNSGGTYVIDDATALHATVSSLVPGTYIFTLKATDNGGAFTTDNIRIIVSPADNVLPLVDAGNSDIVNLPTNTYNFAGSSASDPDGSISSYLWTKVSGPTGGTLTGATTLHATANGLTAGTYVFRLLVTDNSGGQSSDDVTITVNSAPNQPPSVDAGLDATIRLPLNFYQTTATVSDADGTIFSIFWTGTSGPNQFIILNPASTTPTFTNLVEGVYQFTIKATDDDGAINTDVITITVLPAFNLPPVVDAGDDATLVLPNNIFQPNGSVTDPDGAITSMTWTKASGPSSFSISDTHVQNPTISQLVQGTYVFLLTATDDDGATNSDQVTVVVNAAQNQPPLALAGSDLVVQLPTNSVTLSGNGIDNDGTISTHTWSLISGTASITTPSSYTSTVTFSTAGDKVLKLTVTDNGGLSDDDTVIITVNPASNIRPTADAGTDASVTFPTNIYTLAGSGSDVDGTIVAYRWRKLTSSTNYAFSNNTIPNPVVTFSSPGIYSMTLEVTDNAGAVSKKDTINLTVNPSPANIAPNANAGVDITVPFTSNTVSLNGGGSTDLDGLITAYAWVQTDGTTAVITNANTVTPIISGLALGNYTFQLTVTDDKGATSTDTVNVFVISLPNYYNKLRKSLRQ